MSARPNPPRFSIVIPTRDRPDHLRNALQSALKQTVDDFEVIVSDNFVKASAGAVVASFNDDRIRYVRPERPLAMCDHWDFALDQAIGDYVLVLIDKTMLFPSALATLSAAILTHPSDIYSWTGDAYYLTHEHEGSVDRGYLVPVRGRSKPFYVSCRSELERRLAFRTALGAEGPAYGYGKICFGAYSRTLLDRIKKRFGRVFPPISPDYTSMASAMTCADRLVDVGRSCMVSSITTISNGRLFSEHAVHARKFLLDTGVSEADFELFPVPGVFPSVHNLVAYDYRFATAADPKWQPDMPNLVKLVQRDLDRVETWASEAEGQDVRSRFKRVADALGSVQLEATRQKTSERQRRERLINVALMPLRAIRRRFVRSGNPYPTFPTVDAALAFAETDGYRYPIPRFQASPVAR